VIPKRDFEYAPSAAPLEIIHHGQDLIVINKPSGLLSVPGKTEPDCAQARLQALIPNALTVHRLDMATSGLMVFAANPAAQRHLGLQFEKRMARKSYAARVWGEVKSKEGSVDLPLICDWPNRPLQKVCHETGKPAQTNWEVTGREAGITRLALFPLTGRSHQLRVHCLEMGHPIVGDRLYAHDAAFAAAERLQLHAEYLSVRNPSGGAWMEFHAPAQF